jgi:hypothetical protein
MNSSISRRSFLAGAAVTGTVLAAGLAGCEPKVAGGTEDIPVAETKTWRTPPVSISNEDVETEEVDILVIGGGLSGLSAALGAQESGGGSVLVLEKLDKSRVGGNVHAGLDLSSSRLARSFPWYSVLPP